MNMFSECLIRSLGEILIDPPIPASELDDCPFLHTSLSLYQHDVRLIVADEPETVAEGTLIRRHAIAIVPVAGIHQGHRLLRDLQRIADDYGEGRTFTGRFDRIREIGRASCRGRV